MTLCQRCEKPIDTVTATISQGGKTQTYCAKCGFLEAGFGTELVSALNSIYRLKHKNG